MKNIDGCLVMNQSLVSAYEKSNNTKKTPSIISKMKRILMAICYGENGLAKSGI